MSLEWNQWPWWQLLEGTTAMGPTYLPRLGLELCRPALGPHRCLSCWVRGGGNTVVACWWLVLLAGGGRWWEATGGARWVGGGGPVEVWRWGGRPKGCGGGGDR